MTDERSTTEPGYLRFTDGWPALFIVIAVHVVAALLAFDPTPQSGGDNASYRALADALRTAHGYVRLWEPGTPVETLYPPVFPYLLSLAQRAGAHDWAGLNLFMVGCSAAMVGASYLLVRRMLPALAALATALVFALCPGVLELSHAVLSDLPFSAFTALALWAALERSDASPRRRHVMFGVAVAATLLAYFTRSAGLPLFLALVGWLAWHRQWRRAALVVAVLLPFAMWWTMRASAAGAGGYTGYLTYVDPYQPALGRVGVGGLVARIGQNLGRYLSGHLPVLLFGLTDGIFVGFAWLVAALGVAGFATRLRRWTVAELWLPGYLGLVLLWPTTWSGERLLLPLLPVLLAYAAMAIALLRRYVPAWPVAAALAVGALVMLNADVSLFGRGMHCRAQNAQGEYGDCMDGGWNDMFVVARAAKGRLPAGSVVISRKPSIFYVESGYQSLVYPLSSANDTLFAFARQVGARYLVVDGSKLAELYLHDLVREHPSRFCALPALRRQDAALVRIEPAVARSGPDTAAIANCVIDGEH